MEHKPWPLIILAFIHLIEPATKVLFYGFFYNITPLQVVTLLYQNDTPLQLFQFFFLFPIAGIAIYAVKKWSLPVFLLVELLVFSINASYLNELYQTNQLLLFSCFVFFGILNLAIVSYLLIPAVRLAYVDPRIRWWEAEPRYSVSMDCMIDNKTPGKIKNISTKGVFITTDRDLRINSNTRIAFKFIAPSLDLNLNVKVVVRHKFTIKGTEGYGVQFVGLTKDNKHFINALVKFMEKSRVDRRPPRRNLFNLIQWFVTFIKTGEGLIFKAKRRSLHRTGQI